MRGRTGLSGHRLLRSNRIWQALALGAVSLGFLVNMVLVTVSRTAIVTMPIMVGVFALLHLRRRTSLILIGYDRAGGLLWFATPDLRWGPKDCSRNIGSTRRNEHVTSVGLRLEFWQKSLRFISEAPVIGHGTGSMRGLFERAATATTSRQAGNCQSTQPDVEHCGAVGYGRGHPVIRDVAGASAAVSRRGARRLDRIARRGAEHLHLAVQLPLFDFHEGWMYVLGVGVAGGMMLAAKQRDLPAPPAKPR